MDYEEEFLHADFSRDENGHEVRGAQPGQKHKEGLFLTLLHNHVIALGWHDRMKRRYILMIIFLKDEVFSGHRLSARSVFPN